MSNLRKATKYNVCYVCHWKRPAAVVSMLWNYQVSLAVAKTVAVYRNKAAKMTKNWSTHQSL